MNLQTSILPDGRTVRYVPADEAGEFRGEIASRWAVWPAPEREAIERLERDWYESGLGKWPVAAWVGGRRKFGGWDASMITDDEAFDRIRGAMRALTPRQAREVRRVVLLGGRDCHHRQFRAAVRVLARHYGLMGR